MCTAWHTHYTIMHAPSSVRILVLLPITQAQRARKERARVERLAAEEAERIEVQHAT
jgi:hypothetical protein